MASNDSPSQEHLTQIIESAKRLGVEMDEADALQWLSAMALDDDTFRFDKKTGVFGHRVSMLDFSPADLAHFRKLGKLVEFEDTPGKVETALALSGSAAQSKIQTYPGDADFFERINIIADTREEATGILANLMRVKALSTFKGDIYEFIEAKFGSFPFDFVRDGNLKKLVHRLPGADRMSRKGRSSELHQTATTLRSPGSKPLRTLAGASWIGSSRMPPASSWSTASNMLDVTWEAPDGSITPLDGYLDPFSKKSTWKQNRSRSLASWSSMSPVTRWMIMWPIGKRSAANITTKALNYGKAAKRLYNIFRLTGRYVEAAYLRELFDEPTTMLYQVWALIRTVDESFQPGSEIKPEIISQQADKLILAVVETLEGEQESEIVRLLLRLKSLIAEDAARGEAFSPGRGRPRRGNQHRQQLLLREADWRAGDQSVY